MSGMTKKLRGLFQDKRIILRMGVYDALTAKLAERAGFEFIGLSGFSVSASYGKPDIEYLTMTEMVERTRSIVNVVDIPVMADGDTGFGNALNVYRTVQEFEAAGAAMVMLEDQVSPKKCGSMKGKDVVSTKEMIGKIKAALDARKDPDLMILARTDAVDVLGREEALARVKAFEEAGADAVLVMSPGTPEDMKRLNRSVKVPTFITMAETELWVRKNSITSPEKLQEYGYKCASYPTSIVYYVANCVKGLLAEMRRTGLTDELAGKMMQFQELNTMLGLPKYYEQEKKYLSL